MDVPHLQSGALTGDQPHKPQERRASKRLRHNRENQPPESAPKPQKTTPPRNRGTPNSRSGPSRQRSATMPRPLNTAQEPEGPPLTRTGRISKAKKGLKGYHKCHCDKAFSRAEHLRRHQRNHKEKLPCDHPGCTKSFHRDDLLQQHKNRHFRSDTSGSRSSNRSESLVSDPESPQTPRPLETSASYIPITTAKDLEITHRPFVALSTYPTEPGYPSFDLHQYVSQQPFHAPLNIQSSMTLSGASVTVQPPCLSTLSMPLFTDAPTASAGPYATWSGPPQASSTGAYIDPDQGLAGPPYTQPYGYNASNVPNIGGWRQSQYPPVSNSPLSATSTQAPYWPDTRRGVPTPTNPSPYPSASPCPRAKLLVSSPSLEQFTGFVPYPTPKEKSPVHTTTEEYEALLMDQLYGSEAAEAATRHYLDRYWISFHPLFPVLHLPTFSEKEAGPLLISAMAAIGAQYSREQSAGIISRAIHEDCVRLLEDDYRMFSSQFDLRCAQAIFLVEAYSQFRGRRAPQNLSDRFIRLFEALRQDSEANPGITMGSYGDGLPETSGSQLHHGWNVWVREQSKQRLFLAAYIIRFQRANFLAFTDKSSWLLETDLPYPTATRIWDAKPESHWDILWAQRSCSTVSIPQILDDNRSLWLEPPDAFQSVLLIANHAARGCGPHSRQSPLEVALPSQLLDQHASVQTFYFTILLVTKTPIRQLLAVSGESWILSQRLSSNAAEASTIFANLKTELRRDWTDHPLYSNEAVQHAMQVLRIALEPNQDVGLLGFGICLYLSALILWAATYARIHRTGSFLESSIQSPNSSSHLDAEAAEGTVRKFLSEADTVYGPTEITLHQWHHGVSAVLRWAELRIRGGSNTALGELLQGAVSVLEKLQLRGWDEGWF